MEKKLLLMSFILCYFTKTKIDCKRHFLGKKNTQTFHCHLYFDLLYVNETIKLFLYPSALHYDDVIKLLIEIQSSPNYFHNFDELLIQNREKCKKAYEENMNF